MSTDVTAADTRLEERTSSAGRVEHPSDAERAARGKAARTAVPRSAHAAWEPAADRPSPVELLEAQARTRIPELVPIRYGRMLVSPFTFFRGAALLMASDLSRLPHTSLDTQLCGDAHLSNFGFFAAPDRRIIFSINDFDETHPGPFEWDVKRLAASFAVACRHRGFDDKERESVNLAVGEGYRQAMAEYARMGNLEVWYTRVDVEGLREDFLRVANAAQRKRAAKNLEKTRAKGNLKAFAKLTEMVDGRRRIISDPPVVTPIEELFDESPQELEDFLRGVIRSYRRTLPADRRRLLERYRYVHAARKVVGVGSVGTRAFMMLLLGSDDGDPLFLQFKEAEASVLEPFLTKSPFANHGQRVVEGQRLMQAASDIMLGWIRASSPDGIARDFYVRQLWDAKGSALIEVFEPDLMRHYARMCGAEVARAHARSGDRIALAAYLGTSDTFDRALALFAESYANQNERDYEALVEAAREGRITVEAGV